MPPVGFEHTISVLELAKTVHALDRAAIVIGDTIISEHYLFIYLNSFFF
jgi:hypothetical protein